MALLGRVLDKLGQPPEITRALNLRNWTESVPGITPIVKLEPRCPGRAAGVVHNIRIDPRQGTGSIEAAIIDGTGELTARWLGRASLQGVRLGIGLVLQGIVGLDQDGGLVILNPEYELVSGPEHH